MFNKKTKVMRFMSVLLSGVCFFNPSIFSMNYSRTERASKYFCDRFNVFLCKNLGEGGYANVFQLGKKAKRIQFMYGTSKADNLIFELEKENLQNLKNTFKEENGEEEEEEKEEEKENLRNLKNTFKEENGEEGEEEEDEENGEEGEEEEDEENEKNNECCTQKSNEIKCIEENEENEKNNECCTQKSNEIKCINDINTSKYISIPIEIEEDEYKENKLLLSTHKLARGSFSDIIKNIKNVKNPEILLKAAIIQVLKGLHGLHKNNMYHGDLKMGNILYFSKKGKNMREKLIFKLHDTDLMQPLIILNNDFDYNKFSDFMKKAKNSPGPNFQSKSEFSKLFESLLTVGKDEFLKRIKDYELLFKRLDLYYFAQEMQEKLKVAFKKELKNKNIEWLDEIFSILDEISGCGDAEEALKLECVSKIRKQVKEQGVYAKDYNI